MGAHVESTNSSLITGIIEQAAQFSFYQLMGLFDSHPELKNAVLRLQPNSALAFPVRDLEAVKYYQEHVPPTLTVTLNFMGLYGVDSPLPTYFMVLAHQEDEAGQCLRDFLDIFHQRLYCLFYQVWRRYQGSAYLLNNAAVMALRGGRAHTIAQLRQHLLEYFPSLSFDLIGFIPKWHVLDETPHLGRDSILGEMLLGQRFYDSSAHLQIQLNLATLPELMRCLPGLKMSRAISQHIEDYLKPLFTFDLIYHFSLRNVPLPALGSQCCYLGWLTPLGAASAPFHKLTYTSDSLLR